MRTHDRAAPRRIDWRSLRDTIDLADVATRLLGPAPGRRGDGSDRLWWPCAFHAEDHNPSFCVTPGRQQWHCFGCGANGDALALVRRLDPSLTFTEAVLVATGGSGLPTTRRPNLAPRPRPTARTEPKPPPEGWAEMAATFVAESIARLWSSEGEGALAYLRGRGLADETIQAARLGLAIGDRPGLPSGLTIPWQDGTAPTLVKVRRPEGSVPKYQAIKGSRVGGIYPARRYIRPGAPLVIVEGELDALLLGQVLAEIAAVVTLGSASARPSPVILNPMLAAAPWLIATDADPAGDKAADGWPPTAKRVRPPHPHKDWTEAHLGGIDLRRWWRDLLSGDDAPPPLTWEEPSTWRWGPGLDDPTPGIVIDRPDRSRMLAALRAADPCDPYAVAEREAIRSENQPMLLDTMSQLA